MDLVQQMECGVFSTEFTENWKARRGHRARVYALKTFKIVPIVALLAWFLSFDI